MARRKESRAQPVSEKEAGEKSSAGDEVAGLLEGAEPPASMPDGPVEAVASGHQPMPGSASDKETRVATAPKAPTNRNLRELAPKKPAKGPGGQPKNGPTAIERVVSRGIDSGDTSSVAPVELFRVSRGGRAVINGKLCTVSTNARITRLTHDLESLKLQGIEFDLVGRG